MRISVNRKTGWISTPFSADYCSDNLIVFGEIDRLHDQAGGVWNPDLPQVESFLESLSPAELASNITSIEGQYLILWRHDTKTYVFKDRYCIQPIYYFLSSNSLELFDTLLDQGYDLVVPQQNAIAFILMRYVPGRQTLFEGIFQIMPGDCLILDTTTSKLQIEVGCVYPKINVEEGNDNVAAETFHSLFRKALEARIRKYHEGERLLLPLSGGLDSRYVLATALELVPSSRIVAMTFGTPGSYDFEIGRLVAQAAGVRHVAYPLSPENYTGEALTRNCQDTDGQISFTTEAPIWVFENLAQYGRINLSGYVGDAIMGNKAYPSSPDGRQKIVLKDALIRSDDPLADYLAPTLIESSLYYDNGTEYPLDPSEMWFFINHFTKYTTHCVFKFRKQFKYITPFVDYAFLDYVLNLPLEMRMERHLYFDWLQRYFPQLASLPCSLHRGVPLGASSTRRFIAHQFDRFSHYVLGKNRGINNIDFWKYRDQLLEPQLLQNRMAGVLPKEFEQRIFKRQKYYLLLYNLKCLEVMRISFGVNFK